LERDGLKGSLAKFGRRVSLVCFANVPCSRRDGEGWDLFMFLI